MPLNTQGYQKFLHPMGVQEMTSQKSSDNVETIAGCMTVPANYLKIFHNISSQSPRARCRIFDNLGCKDSQLKPQSLIQMKWNH